MAIVGSFSKELLAILTHIHNADEVEPDKIGEFGIEKNQHFYSNLIPASAARSIQSCSVGL